MDLSVSRNELESLANLMSYHFQMITKDILIVTRATDKKQIVYLHDKSLDYEVDPEFQQLWRNSSVEGMHDDNIDEYLSKQVSRLIYARFYSITLDIPNEVLVI